jgi:hypothetical protein
VNVFCWRHESALVFSVGRPSLESKNIFRCESSRVSPCVVETTGSDNSHRKPHLQVTQPLLCFQCTESKPLPTKGERITRIMKEPLSHPVSTDDVGPPLKSSANRNSGVGRGSCSLLRSLLRRRPRQEEASMHSDSLHRPSVNCSVTTLWNESKADENDKCGDVDVFALNDETVTTTSAVSLDSYPNRSDSLTSSVFSGKKHISSRLEKYGIIKRPTKLSTTPATTSQTQVRTASLRVQRAVEEIHRWLFVEGGHFEDVQALMTQYSNYVRDEYGIPLDRLFMAV